MACDKGTGWLDQGVTGLCAVRTSPQRLGSICQVAVGDDIDGSDYGSFSAIAHHSAPGLRQLRFVPHPLASVAATLRNYLTRG
jgi:hypothetical protein